MKKIVILGRGGAGKSTTAKRLKIKEFHTLSRQIFWKPGLVATPIDEWRKFNKNLLQVIAG